MTDESSLPVDNTDGHETTEDSSSSMVAKKGSKMVVCAIQSLAKPDKCRQQAGTVVSSSGYSSNGRKSKMSSQKKEPSGHAGSTDRVNACCGVKGGGSVMVDEGRTSLYHTRPG